MSRHTCHARGCNVEVRPELLMCPAHWRAVPRAIQSAVRAAYRAGQCAAASPSVRWLACANAAIGYVAFLERVPLRVAETNALRALGYETGVDERGELFIRAATANVRRLAKAGNSRGSER